MRQWIVLRARALEEHVTRQVERRSAQQHKGRWEIHVPRRMRDADLVGDGAHHDAGDDRDMEVCVYRAAYAPRVGGGGDLAAAALGPDVEVDPPHRDAAE